MVESGTDRLAEGFGEGCDFESFRELVWSHRQTTLARPNERLTLRAPPPWPIGTTIWQVERGYQGR